MDGMVSIRRTLLGMPPGEHISKRRERRHDPVDQGVGKQGVCPRIPSLVGPRDEPDKEQDGGNNENSHHPRRQAVRRTFIAQTDQLRHARLQARGDEEVLNRSREIERPTVSTTGRTVGGQVGALAPHTVGSTLLGVSTELHLVEELRAEVGVGGAEIHRSDPRGRGAGGIVVDLGSLHHALDGVADNLRLDPFRQVQRTALAAAHKGSRGTRLATATIDLHVGRAGNVCQKGGARTCEAPTEVQVGGVGSGRDQGGGKALGGQVASKGITGHVGDVDGTTAAFTFEGRVAVCRAKTVHDLQRSRAFGTLEESLAGLDIGCAVISHRGGSNRSNSRGGIVCRGCWRCRSGGGCDGSSQEGQGISDRVIHQLLQHIIARIEARTVAVANVGLIALAFAGLHINHRLGWDVVKVAATIHLARQILADVREGCAQIHA